MDNESLVPPSDDMEPSRIWDNLTNKTIRRPPASVAKEFCGSWCGSQL